VSPHSIKTRPNKPIIALVVTVFLALYGLASYAVYSYPPAQETYEYIRRAPEGLLAAELDAATVSALESVDKAQCLKCHPSVPEGKPPVSHLQYLTLGQQLAGGPDVLCSTGCHEPRAGAPGGGHPYGAVSTLQGGTGAGSTSCSGGCHSPRGGAPGAGHPYGAVAPSEGGTGAPTGSCSASCHEQRNATPGPGHPYGGSPTDPGAPSDPGTSCSAGCHDTRSGTPGPGHPYNSVQPTDPSAPPVACYASCHGPRNGTPEPGHPNDVLNRAGEEDDD